MACLPSKMSGPGGCCYHPPGPTQPLLQGAVMPKNHTQTPRAAQAEVEYRDIPGFPGYRVGSDGSIWSNCGTGLNRGTVPWAQKKLHADGGGYPKASFCVGGKSFRRRVHRAVLEAFVGPAPPGAVCRHLDGNPVNNRLENLACRELCGCRQAWHQRQGREAPRLKTELPTGAVHSPAVCGGQRGSRDRPTGYSNRACE
jgi:hypothetical protein